MERIKKETDEMSKADDRRCTDIEKKLGRKLSPSEFAKFYFNFIPQPYQQAALDCQGRYVALNWGRQTGKSTITAIRGLWHAITYPNQLVLTLSPRQSQSNILFDKMRKFLLESHRKFPELSLYEEIARPTRTVFEFNNGSEIRSLPIVEDGSNLRGFTVDMVIVDEASRLKSETAWSAIKPMIITTGGKMWLISTPRGTNNYFYRVHKDPTLGFKYFHATSYDNPLSDLKQIESDREWMPENEWREEYMAEFLDESGQFFPIRIIDNFFLKQKDEREMPVSNCVYYLGVDPAGAGSDDTVMAILEKGPNHTMICKYIQMRKVDTGNILGKIKQLHEMWKFKNILVDITGIGTGLGDMLKEHGLPVVPIYFTLRQKEDLYNNLKLLIERNDVHSVWNDLARKQLADIRFEYSIQGSVRLFSATSLDHKKPGFDDYVSAMVLACWGLRRQRQPVIFSASRSVFDSSRF